MYTLARVICFFVIVLAVAVLHASPSAAGRIHVKWDATGANDGTSWTDAFIDLQDGLAAAAGGDEIWVARGTYKPTSGTDRTATFQLADGVALYGGFDGTESQLLERDVTGNPTTLSGDIGETTSWDNSLHVVTGSGTSASAVLDGFIVRRGWAVDPFPNDRGAGMLNLAGSPTIRRVTFADHTARDGAAVYNSDGSPRMFDVVFTNNGTGGSGGGIYNDNVDLILGNIVFSGNRATSGGGMYSANSTLTMANVTFEGNGTEQDGGGMYAQGGAFTLTNAIFIGNSGGKGGALATLGVTAATIVNVVFHGNEAIIAGNGGALHNVASSPVLTNVTFSHNTALEAGGALYNAGGDPTLTNTIFYGNTAPLGEQIHNVVGTPTYAHSLIEGSGGSGPDWDPALGADGGHNIDDDPLFVNAPLGDVHLESPSPAINRGDNDAPGLPPLDLDGNLRIIWFVVDMGAYESMSPTAIGDGPTASLPRGALIRSAHPNPFNPTLTVTFRIDRALPARVTVFDIRGRRVRSLVDEVRGPGVHTVTWDAADDDGRPVASGVYFVRVRSGDTTDERKVVLLK